MAGIERDFEIGVPADGRYTEIFNSDHISYGGTGILNEGRLEARRKEVDGMRILVTGANGISKFLLSDFFGFS